MAGTGDEDVGQLTARGIHLGHRHGTGAVALDLDDRSTNVARAAGKKGNALDPLACRRSQRRSESDFMAGGVYHRPAGKETHVVNASRQELGMIPTRPQNAPIPGQVRGPGPFLKARHNEGASLEH